jgi:hypothetical protein
LSIAPPPPHPPFEALPIFVHHFADFRFWHFEKLRDDVPPAPDGAEFRGTVEHGLLFGGESGHGKLGWGIVRCNNSTCTYVPRQMGSQVVFDGFFGMSRRFAASEALLFRDLPLKDHSGSVLFVDERD